MAGQKPLKFFGRQILFYVEIKLPLVGKLQKHIRAKLKSYFLFHPQNPPPSIGDLLQPQRPQKAVIRTFWFFGFQLRKGTTVICDL